MNEWVVATGNAGKLQEFSALLAPLGYTLRGFDSGVEETGATYEENARLKARFACERTGLPALADDSGLEADALGGAPGLYSARYAGGAADNWRLLLHNMEGSADRKARFVCCIVVCFPDGREIVARGVCEGEIACAPRGDGGFGYDPVFFLPPYGKTMAELDPALKNEISHRGQALKDLVSKL